MGVCKYCGQPAGLFHSVHNGCLQLHETGTLEIMALLSHSLTGIESLSSDESELTDRIKTIGSQSFVTEAEQHDLILRALQNAVTEALKDDLLSEDEEKRLVALTQRLSLSKEELSKNPAFKRIVAAAVIRDILAGVTPRWSVTEGELHELTLKAFEKAVTDALGDDVLSEDEEKRLIALTQRLSLSKEELDKNPAFNRLVKAAVIRDILSGVIPKRMNLDTSSVNLERDEVVVWAFANAPYYEDRTQRSYVGGSHGVSVRVMKGVYYRTSTFEGHPVDRTTRIAVDTGLVLITDKNIYFSGPQKSLRVPYKKIVSFQPFSDGFGLIRDAASAKPQIFVTGDGWFAYNLVTNLAIPLSAKSGHGVVSS